MKQLEENVGIEPRREMQERAYQPENGRYSTFAELYLENQEAVVGKGFSVTCCTVKGLITPDDW